MSLIKGITFSKLRNPEFAQFTRMIHERTFCLVQVIDHLKIIRQMMQIRIAQILSNLPFKGGTPYQDSWSCRVKVSPFTLL